MAAVKFTLQLATAHRYGYFRDELFFLDLSKHLDWGYLDQPPFAIAVTAASRVLLGTSLTALRFLPALAGAVKVALAGLIARELGGGRFAQMLAALAVLVAPAYLGADHLLTTNTFDALFWTGCAYALIRAIKTDDPKFWLWFGVLAGLGAENKYSMFFFGFGLLVGLMLSSQRRLLMNRWFWLAVGIAFLIFLPNLVWQLRRGLPSLAWLLYHRVASDNVRLTPLAFMGEQIIELQPLTCPIWVAGLWYYLRSRAGQPYRLLGWTYLVVLALLLILRGRVYYLFPAYPMLLGSGAIVIEKALNKLRWNWLKPAYVMGLLLGGALFAPFALPVLTVEAYMRYSDVVNIDPPDIETRKLGKLPQLYADTFGWKEMTAAVALAYESLPLGQRSKTAIFANTYGEAGALDFFGPPYGLPPVISPHQNYFYWGPGDYDGLGVILLGHNPALESQCATEEPIGVVPGTSRQRSCGRPPPAWPRRAASGRWPPRSHP
ncbi:MAG TPA: glycosyltransferase family 39 protein [Terriglobia bacterium]